MTNWDRIRRSYPLVVWLVYLIAPEPGRGFLSGRPLSGTGLAVALVVVYERIAHWADHLLSDVIFIPLIVGWALLSVNVLRRPTLRTSAVVPAGILWGLAVLTRGTALLGCLLVLPFFARALSRRFGVWWRPTVVLVVTMVAVVSMATVRNYVVARQFIPIFTSGANSLIVGNPPPPSIQLGAGPRDGLYRPVQCRPTNTRCRRVRHTGSTRVYAGTRPQGMVRARLVRRASTRDWTIGLPDCLLDDRGGRCAPGWSWPRASRWDCCGPSGTADCGRHAGGSSDCGLYLAPAV